MTSLDQYSSPEWAINELTKYVDISGLVLDPCVGNNPLRIGHITNDIDPAIPAGFHLDARVLNSWEQFGPIDWVITNPPFNSAFVIVQRAFEFANKGIAFILRLSFVEPTLKRQRWLVAHPPDLQIVLPRYSFSGSGKDFVTCAWMIWYKSNPQRIGTIISDRGL